MGLYEVKRYVNTVFASNTYVVSRGGVGLCMVDVGDVQLVEEGLSALRSVFLSHVHFDHIYGLNRLLELCPDMVVYTSAYGREALYSDRLNFSRYHECPFVFKGKNVVVLREGDKVDFGDGLEMEVFETPGHNPGCLCYRMGRYLFTGDSFIPGVPTVTKLRGGDKETDRISLEKIKGLVTRETVVCPGHGVMVGGGVCVDKYFE